jgi:hypothetical protein
MSLFKDPPPASCGEIGVQIFMERTASTHNTSELLEIGNMLEVLCPHL